MPIIVDKISQIELKISKLVIYENIKHFKITKKKSFEKKEL